MKIHVLVRDICLVSSIVCVGTVYLLAGHWSILVALPAMMIFWIIMKTRSAFWSASSLLFVYVFLAAIGVVMNLSVPLLAVGCACALASWDLTHVGGAMLDQENPEARVRLERQHLRSLAMAFSLGLAFALLGMYLSLQLPFLISVILVLIAISSLTYGLQAVVKNNS